MPSFDFASALAGKSAELRVPEGRHLTSAKITRSVTLTGARGAVLDGGGNDGVLEVDAPGQTVTLRGLGFEHGHASAGALVRLTAGRLVIEGCTFAHGEAKAYGGGAIAATGGTLEVRRSVFIENIARQGGAVLLDNEAEARFVDCLFARNASVQGGALRLREAAQARLVGCTLAHNRCVPNPEVRHAPAGGAFFVSGSTTRRPKLSLENCVVAPLEGEVAADGFNDAAVPGEIAISHSLVSASLKPLADASCKVGAPAFVEGDYAPSKKSAAVHLASASAFRAVDSTIDLAGVARADTAGAFEVR